MHLGHGRCTATASAPFPPPPLLLLFWGPEALSVASVPFRGQMPLRDQSRSDLRLCPPAQGGVRTIHLAARTPFPSLSSSRAPC